MIPVTGPGTSCKTAPGGSALDRDLIAHGHPATVYRKWGVPLLWVFPFSDIEAWEKSALPGLE